MENKTKWGLSLVTASLIAFVATWEGTSYKVYADVGGVLTVCQGYTGPEVKLGDTWTKAQCDEVLKQALAVHGAGVLNCTHRPMNQAYYEAVTSFAYNVGVSAYCKSTMRLLIDAGEFTAACNEFTRWTKVHGRKWRGLMNRREAEKRLCLRSQEA